MNYTNSEITMSLQEEISAQSLHLLTLQTIKSMIEHETNEVWLQIYKNCLRIMEGGEVNV